MQTTATIAKLDEGLPTYSIVAETNYGDAYIVQQAIQAEFSEDEFPGLIYDSEGSCFYAFTPDRYLAEDIFTALVNELDKLGYQA